MNLQDVNVILGFTVLAAAIAAAVVWMSPKGAEWLAVRLKARAAGMRAGRAAYREAAEDVLHGKVTFLVNGSELAQHTQG